MARLRDALWRRFLWMSFAGKVLTVGLVLLFLAWTAAKLGIHDLAHELASAAWFVLSVLAVGLICRHIFLRFTYRNPYR